MDSIMGTRTSVVYSVLIMTRREPISMRIIAAVLPICFVWAMVACATLCSINCVEEQPTDLLQTIASNETETGDPDCCPIKAGPSSELPARPAIAAQLIAIEQP